MTKEELENRKLERRAKEWLIKDKGGSIIQSLVNLIKEFTEPREKQMQALGERCLQLQKDKGNLTDKCNKLEEAKANLEYLLEGRDNEIDELKKENKVLEQNLEDTEICENGWKNRVTELEAQIEKMKADVKQGQSYWNSGEMQYDLYQRLLDKWEIKEND